MWAYESTFYQIYPLGFCGAPFENDGKLEHRISRDIYPPAYAYGDFKSEYDDLKNITAAHKGAALAENGILPNVKKLADTKVPWLWYMIWSGAFVLTENYNEYVVLKELYNHDYAITLDKLPKLY